jgi:hypothetical protein
MTMERERDFTRSIVSVLWTVALAGLGLWFLLALGGHMLLSDSGAWLHALIEPWVTSASWGDTLATLLAWGESVGTVTLWSVWALGTLGLLLTAGFATLLYVRAQRAMAAPR